MPGRPATAGRTPDEPPQEAGGRCPLEAQLLVRERQFADSQALAHVGSWERDMSVPRAVWTDELCRIFGQPLGFSPTTDRLLELVHPDDRAIVIAQLQRALDGERDEARYRIRRPDGQVRQVYAVAEGRRDADGTLRYRYGTVQDVTEWLEAARAGREARELFETAFSHAPTGMALTALDGRWLKVNAALCAFLERSEDEVMATRLEDITHPDDLAASIRGLTMLQDGEIAAFHTEKRYLTPAGVKWAVLSVTLLRDESGGPRHYISQIQDVTERKAAQVRLQEAETQARRERDHARAILAAMSDGYVLTVDGEIRDVNDAMCALTGLSAEALIGTTPPYAFWPAEHLPALSGVVSAVRADNGGRHEVTLMRAGGDLFDAEVTTRPFCDEAGNTIGYVNTVRDVSAQRRHQRELERLARTDSLTALSNRHVLQEALGREAARRGDGGNRLALVLLDLDHFKQVNDEFGHPAGDAVLVEVARRLERTVRAGEVLARVGGEEFAWLLPASGVDEAVAAANRARAAIGSAPFAGAGRLTMSAGVAVVPTPSDGDALYRLADRALYEAKQRGRDRTCWREGDALAPEVTVADTDADSLAVTARRLDAGLGTFA